MGEIFQVLRLCILLGGGFPVPAIKGGAIETLIEILLKEYEKFEDEIDISIITKKDDTIDYSQFKRVNFIFVPSPYVWFEKLYWKLYGFCKKLFGIELIAPLPRLFEKKFIKKHKDDYEFFIEETKLNIYDGLGMDPNKIIYHLHYGGDDEFKNNRLFGNLIAISDYIKSYWNEHTGRRDENSYVLKNCIDVDKFKKTLSISDEDKRELKEKLGIPLENKVVLYVGRFVPEKGVLELIKAFNTISAKATLLLVGSANFSQKTMTEYEKLVLEEISSSKKQIITTGFIRNDEIYRYHAISDLAVIPSTWLEPAGLVELEYQAAGVPIIATNVGGIPEFVSIACKLIEKENLIENLSTAIDTVINDKEKLIEMKEMGIEFVKDYSQDSYYKNFVRILKDINARNGCE